MPEGAMRGGGPPNMPHQGEFQRGHMPGGIRIGGIALPIEIARLHLLGYMQS
jgi:hypothetical protein